MSRFALPLLAAALVASPALAGPIVVSGAMPSIRTLEFNDGGSNGLERARSALMGAVPVGMPVGQARVALRHVGLDCDRHADAALRCTAASFEAQDDQLHDVVWTVEVQQAAGLVSALTVDRASIGS